MNAYQLANLAGVASPDAPDSPGAEWLELIYGDALETIDQHGGDYDAMRDEIGERADQLVPIYTYHRWQVFADLAAWSEDASELGDGGGSDMTDLAGVCLYMIADRLIGAVIDDHESETA